MTDGDPAKLEAEKVEPERWNEATKKGLRRLQIEVENLATERKTSLEANARSVFRDLRVMIWVTFVLGFVLVALSVIWFAFGKGTPSVLGMGAVGVADLFALFFYKPMDRLQSADKDYLQQIVVLKTWAISVNLEMLSMSFEDRQSLLDASKNVRSAGYFAASSLQDFVMHPPQEPSAPKQTKTPQAHSQPGQAQPK